MAFRRVAAGACALIGRRVGVGADPTQQMRVAAGASALIGRRLGVGAAPTQQMRGYCQKTLAPEERMSLRSQSVHFFIIGFSGAFFVYAMWYRFTKNRMWQEAVARKY